MHLLIPIIQTEPLTDDEGKLQYCVCLHKHVKRVWPFKNLPVCVQTVAAINRGRTKRVGVGWAREGVTVEDSDFRW